MLDTITSIEKFEEFVRSQPYMMSVLEHARLINLPDWWIGAWFLRNPVRDLYHHQAIVDFGTDIDLVYYNSVKFAPEDDRAFDEYFTQKMPWTNRNVRNQARMHLKNWDEPYLNTRDWIAHRNETATSIAIKLNHDDTFSRYAAYWRDDLWNCICRPTPSNFKEKADVYRQRRIDKSNRQTRRPQLHIITP